MRKYIGPKLKEAISEEWEIAQKEKPVKTGNRSSKRMLIRASDNVKTCGHLRKARLIRAGYIRKTEDLSGHRQRGSQLIWLAVELYKLGDEVRNRTIDKSP